MIQEIITYIIITAAFGTVFLNALKFFGILRKKKKHASACGSCSGACEVKELHIASKTNFRKQGLYQFYR